MSFVVEKDGRVSNITIKTSMQSEYSSRLRNIINNMGKWKPGLKDGRTVIKGIEDLILSKVEYFLNYNDRYFNYLSLSLNTIMFAEKMSYIKIEDNKIIPIKEEIEKINFNDNELGNRTKNVYKASNNIVKILQEDVKELYFKLRVEI